MLYTNYPCVHTSYILWNKVRADFEMEAGDILQLGHL